MGLFAKRERSWPDMAADPQLPFQVGRMVGAYKLAAALLSKESNETAQVVAAALDDAADWFLDRGGVPQSGSRNVKVRKPDTWESSSEMPTEVKPPAEAKAQ